MKLGPLQRKWLAALRSGKYKQTNGVLHNYANGGFCCLGVAAHVCLGAEPLKLSSSGSLSRDAFKAMGLRDGSGHAKKYKRMKFFSLAELNDGIDDGQGYKHDPFTFKQIAAILSKHPTRYFTESK